MRVTSGAKRRIFYGWWIVLASSAIHFWSSGTFYYSFTAFFNPIRKELGLSYAATALAVSFRSLETGIAAPLVGLFVDRFGPRKLMLLGVAWGGFGFILLSRIHSLWTFYAVFLFLSTGFSLCLGVPGFAAVANWFVKKRGIAMGLLSASSGVSGALIALMTWLIATYEWRTTLVIAGIVVWVIGIPAALVVRHRPEQYGFLPDGAEREAESAESAPLQKEVEVARSAEIEFSAGQALRTRSFWLLTLAITASGAGLSAVMVHIMPFFDSVEISRGVASSLAASLAAISVVGRLGFGWLGDRWEKRYLLAVTFLLQTLGLLFLAYTQTLWPAILFLILFGPGFGGAITLRLAIQGDYFGRKAFGSIQGVMLGIYLMGHMVSPVFAGWVFDVQGSYRLAWIALALIILSAIPITLALRPPSPKTNAEKALQ